MVFVLLNTNWIDVTRGEAFMHFMLRHKIIEVSVNPTDPSFLT